MAFLDEGTQAQVKEVFEPITQEVELLVFTGSDLVVPGKDATGHQKETLELLKEVASLNDKITVTETPLAGNKEAKEAGITLAPTIVFREKGSDRLNTRFAGIPSGYEFQTLVEAILLFGTKKPLATDTAKEELTGIKDNVTMQIFVTPTCPYCPKAVLTAIGLAYDNENIVAEGVDANEFPIASQANKISGVPDAIIAVNGKTTEERILGAQPERVFVESILKVAPAA